MAETVNLPDGLTAADFEPWLRDNPRATLSDAVKEYLVQRSRDESKPLSTVIREGYAHLVAGPTAGLSEGAGRFFQSSLLNPENWTLRGVPRTLGEPAEGGFKAAGDVVAKAAIPQTPEALALTAALGPIARVGSAPGRVLAEAPIRALLTRLGMAGAVGGGAAALTGGDFASGAMQGVTGQGVGEVARATQALYGIGRNVITRRSQLGEARRNAEAAVEGILADVPGLTHPASGLPATRLRGNDASQWLADVGQRTRGQAALSATFQRADDEIVKVMGNTPVTLSGSSLGIPSMTITKIPPVGAPMPGQAGPAPIQVGIKEALNELKLARRAAAKAPPGADGWAVRQNAEQMEREILNAVTLKDPAVASMYQAEAGKYWRGMRVLEALDESGAFAGPVQRGAGATFDATKFLDYLFKNRETLGPDALPNTWRSLLQGARMGGRPVTIDVGGERLYFGGGASTRIPAQLYQIEPRGGAPRTPGGFNPQRQLTIPTISAIVGANAASGYVAE